jgi:hypothetical protein
MYLTTGHGLAVKFTIEIYTTAPDGSEAVLLRTNITALSPLAARKRPAQGPQEGQSRPGLNAQGEVVYIVE